MFCCDPWLDFFDLVKLFEVLMDPVVRVKEFMFFWKCPGQNQTKIKKPCCLTNRALMKCRVNYLALIFRAFKMKGT